MSLYEQLKSSENEPPEPTRLPGGTVTFLFTDIEGSTELLKTFRGQYPVILAAHKKILRQVVARWDGYEVDTQGDAFFFSFARATQAISAAVEAQLSLTAYPWPNEIRLRVRMGLHTGEPWKAEEGYTGIDVHRAARIAHAGHGGQVLLSETTTSLIIGDLPRGTYLLDLGYHVLKDLPRPEHIHQLVIDGLDYKFPPLRSQWVVSSDSDLSPEVLQLPDFLKIATGLPVNRPVFVARVRELEKLNRHLKQAVIGQGAVIFITGSPGRGKTALMNEFSWQAMEHYPDILVVKGVCDAYSGEGDPYLPFRDVLSMLSGDLETRYSAGLINHDQAKLLWNSFPEVVQVLLDNGVDLINRLLDARDLLSRAQLTGMVPSDTLGRLQVLVQQSSVSHSSPDVNQFVLFAQFTQVLSKLAKHHPIMLILDDLQWMDIGSIQLLFHLGRRLAGNKILLVSAYRGEDVAQGRAGGRHPLEELLAEFKRQYGDIWIDLEKKDVTREQSFVDSYLDTEPNRFSPSFRSALYKHTEGHPLFTIELLRNLREKGDLVCDQEGRWIERDVIDWHTIPPKVEGVIEERVGRLPKDQREILSIASVEGENFTAQVIGRIQKLDESILLKTLSQSLNRQHRLIKDRGIEKVGENQLFLFGFQHNLFQKYLYDQLTEPERVMLHHAVGDALEILYSGNMERISPQLARHFDIAGLAEKAVQYYSMAGQYAMRVSANHEAIARFRRALFLLNNLPASPERSAQELNLQLSLGPALTSIKGWAAEELEKAYDRARELCSELTDDGKLIRTLWLLAIYWMGRSDHNRVNDILEQLGQVADRSGDPQFTWIKKIDAEDVYQGKFVQASESLEGLYLLYDPEQQRRLAQIYGMAPLVVGQAYYANCLWILGYPDRAKQAIQEASLWAKELDIPFTTCYYLGRACWLYAQLDDWDATRTLAEMLLRISHKHRFMIFEQSAIFYLHYVTIMLAIADDGDIEQMHQAMEAYSSTGTFLNRTSWLVLFAEACLKVKCIEPGMDAINEAISLGEKTGEVWVQAEAYRLKGELLAAQSQDNNRKHAAYTELPNSFLRAIEIARSQSARSWELRATASLVKLDHQLEIPEGALQLLNQCYQGFTEGFDTPDLLDAQKLLQQ